MLEEDGATQALADVTPAPSEDDVESRPSPKRTTKKTSRAARRGKHQGRHQEGAPSQSPLECLVLSLAMRRPSPKKSRKDQQGF